MRLLLAITVLAASLAPGSASLPGLLCKAKKHELKDKPAAKSLLALGSRHEPRYHHGGTEEIPLNSDDGMYACHVLCTKYATFQPQASMKCAHQCHNLGLSDIPADSPQCQPIVDTDVCDIEIEFEDVDSNHDGEITEDEVHLYGRLMCIPYDQIHALFVMVDTSQDHIITDAEWNSAGEDSAVEEGIDEAVDDAIKNASNIPKPGETQEDLEKEAQKMIESLAAAHSVQAPSFQSLDKNQDGGIQDWELFSAFMMEISDRHPDISVELRKYITDKFWDAVDDIFPRLDKDGNHVISQEEYAAASSTNDMGDELQEAQQEGSAQEEAEEDDPQPGLNTAPQDQGQQNQAQQGQNFAEQPPEEASDGSEDSFLQRGLRRVLIHRRQV